MNTLRIIVKIKRGFDSILDNTATKKKMRILSRVITTRVFSKLSLRDKITSIAKLIMVSEDEYGIAPKALEQALVRLSNDLKREVEQTQPARN